MIGPCETIAEVPLFERIQTALVDARRARDENALSTLSLLKSEVVRASKEPGASGQADDQLVERVIRKEIKRRQEAIDIYRKAGRDDSARKEEAEGQATKIERDAAREKRTIENEMSDESGGK